MDESSSPGKGNRHVGSVQEKAVQQGFAIDVQTKPATKPLPSPRGRGAGGEGDSAQIIPYRHGDRRRNNPEVGMVTPATDPAQPQTVWSYDPHLDPALQFDSSRAAIEKLIDDALASDDLDTMREAIKELKRLQSPYLAWTGKAERTSFEVDTVSLHVHERMDPATVLSAVRKQFSVSSIRVSRTISTTPSASALPRRSDRS